VQAAPLPPAMSYSADGRVTAAAPPAPTLAPAPPARAPRQQVSAAMTPAPAPAAPPQTAQPESAPPPPAPQRLADNSAAAMPAAGASNAVPVRYYSLHRAYGMTPDPVPTPQDRPMVLIGPPDNPPAQAPSGDSVSGENQDGGGDAASGSDTTPPGRQPGAQDSN